MTPEDGNGTELGSQRDADFGGRRARFPGFDKSGQASRLISAGKLNASPRLHSQSIEVVVFDRP